MTYSAQFARFVDKQLGAMGNKLGKPYKAYRLTPASTGDFPTGWYLVSSQVSAQTNRVRSQDADVSMTSERTLWYELALDCSPFWLGDVFISADPPFFPGVSYGPRATSLPGTIEFQGFALAWHEPLRPPIAARIDHRCFILRADELPVAEIDGSLQWRPTREDETPLVLLNGTYTWGPIGTLGSLVPCGFGTSDRQTRGEDMSPDPPGMVPVPRYYVYLPPLPGYTAAEGDTIITEDDARYKVIAPYRQETGVVGHQLMVQRYISQST